MGVETSSIAANVEAVRERIDRAARRAGRRPEEITLVAVAKTFPPESIRQAYRAGVRHFGENRVQEWEEKRPFLEDMGAVWHLVGHLQSNKVARAVRLFDAIDSIDSLALVEKLNRASSQAADGSSASSRGVRTPLPILIEAKVAPEETKSGIDEADLPRLAEAILALPQLDLRGLMCLPPYLEDVEQIRPHFGKLRELRHALARQLNRSLPELSMGMSHDFEVAIEEGATQVRLGTAIFGPRV